MFRRLHIQMTFFSALIIGIVIFIMTTACNFIAETAQARMRGIPFEQRHLLYLSLETRVSSAVTGFCRQKKIMIFPWISETTEILFI